MSETSASVTSGFNVLSNTKNVEIEKLHAMLASEGIMHISQTLDIKSSEGCDKSSTEIRQALTAAIAFLENANDSEDAATTAAMFSPRLFLASTALLPLRVAFNDRKWWAAATPASQTEDDSLQE